MSKAISERVFGASKYIKVGDYTYFSFVKRLGQWHLCAESDHPVFDGENGALCGMPCLGNNHEFYITDRDRDKCPRCFALAEAMLKERL